MLLANLRESPWSQWQKKKPRLIVFSRRLILLTWWHSDMPTPTLAWRTKAWEFNKFGVVNLTYGKHEKQNLYQLWREQGALLFWATVCVCVCLCWSASTQYLGGVDGTAGACIKSKLVKILLVKPSVKQLNINNFHHKIPQCSINTAGSRNKCTHLQVDIPLLTADSTSFLQSVAMWLGTLPWER